MLLTVSVYLTFLTKWSVEIIRFFIKIWKATPQTLLILYFNSGNTLKGNTENKIPICPRYYFVNTMIYKSHRK